MVPPFGAVVEVGVSVVGSRSLPVLQFSVVQKQKVSLISPIMWGLQSPSWTSSGILMQSLWVPLREAFLAFSKNERWKLKKHFWKKNQESVIDQEIDVWVSMTQCGNLAILFATQILREINYCESVFLTLLSPLKVDVKGFLHFVRAKID